MPTGAIQPNIGRPGITARTDAGFRLISTDGKLSYKPQAGVISGPESRDLGNTGFENTLRGGLILAKNTSTNKYGVWSIGVTSGALAGSGTSITLSAAAATELVRRVGATGTFVLTGPPTASGTARQLTATYSGVNTTTGVVTITALGVNQVEQVRFNIASTGGNLQLNVAKTDGTFVTTANIAWNATDATYLAAINSALDTATGVVGGIVATAISATDTDLGFVLTYSGTGYAGLSWRRAEVALLPTSSTLAFYVPVTTAVNGAFVAGSVVSKVGWSLPSTVIGTDVPVIVPTDGTDTEAWIPEAGRLIETQLLPYASDSGLRTWIRQNMSTVDGDKFIFDSVT